MAIPCISAGVASAASTSGPARPSTAIEVPTDIVFQVLYCRLRFKLSYRDSATEAAVLPDHGLEQRRDGGLFLRSGGRAESIFARASASDRIRASP
ncbi:MAG: hypothetical protein ACFBSF_05810 [Leptolyngbyaceae cyanobacterium]